ncbi:MAG: glycine oxidase ThiO [Bacteroidetes bacterium]|nr:glycine oxidase ThiO [Bacteroidota bacterium]
MKKQPTLETVAVVGGGMAGLMSAYFLAKAGFSVTLFEKNTCGSGTTKFAAGMLAPVSELEFTELSLLRIGMESRELYNELEWDLGDIGLIRAGTLEVGLEADDEAYLRRSFEFQQQQGLNVKWVDAKAIQEIDPFVAANIPFGIYSADDIQIDHFLLIQILLDRLPKMGVEICEHNAMLALSGATKDKLRLLATFGEWKFDRVVMTVGAFGGETIPLPMPIYPIRGEVISLAPPLSPFLRTTIRIRSRIYGNAYVVPKPDCIIVGTTSDEKGFAPRNTFGGILNIARKCYAAVPGLYDLDILEIGAGLRPATLDRLPMIGKEQGREVYHLNGLYRHGILLSPLMGKAMADLVQNRKLSPDFAAFGIR